MLTSITLSFLNSSHQGQAHTYTERTTCLIGRGDDCDIQLPTTKEFSAISRRHCLLNINPPQITIRDLGSKSGTYINEQKIGQRPKHLSPEEAQKLSFIETELKDNDTIRIDTLLIQVTTSYTAPKSDTFQFSQAQQDEEALVAAPPQGNLMDFVKGWLKKLIKGDDPDPSLLPIHGYYLSEVLGKGAFGEVYLATHQKTQNQVALKVMLPEVANHPRQKEQFLREVENTKPLKHPNIVQLLDYGFSEGIFYFTLEYCEADNLEQYLEKFTKPLTVKEALSLIIPILDGLHYAHAVEIPYVKQRDGGLGTAKGLVHRDLKPSNILLTEKDGKLIPKIADFGIAKAFDNAGLSGLSRSGQHLEGTFPFMSRAQVLHFKYAQPEIDVWAAAACLYYLLTRKYPRDFGGDPLLTVLQTHPVPIQRRNTEIPDRLATVIDQALDDSGKLHFQTALEFKQALLKASNQ